MAQDLDCQLVDEFDVTFPEQTSSTQTVYVATTKLSTTSDNPPYLLLYEFKGEYPETPSKKTMVKKWELSAPHSNYGSYVYNEGAWSKEIGTDGAVTSNYGSQTGCCRTLKVSAFQKVKNRIKFEIQAAETSVTFASGLWHIKLYRLSGK